MINVLPVLYVLAIILQILAAWFAYKIYQFNRLSWWWLALIIAFVFQAYHDWMGIDVNNFFEGILMFLISLFLALGLWSMLKNFENFEVVEKKVSSKIKGVKRK